MVGYCPHLGHPRVILTIRAGQSHLMVCWQNRWLMGRHSNKTKCSIYCIEKHGISYAVMTHANFWAATSNIWSANASSWSMMTTQEVFSANRRQNHARKATCSVTRKLVTEFQASYYCYCILWFSIICSGGVSMTEDSQEQWLWSINKTCPRSLDGFCDDFNHFDMLKDSLLEFLVRHSWQDVPVIGLDQQLARVHAATRLATSSATLSHKASPCR